MMQSLRPPIAGAVIAAPAAAQAAPSRPSVSFTDAQGQEVLKVVLNK